MKASLVFREVPGARPLRADTIEPAAEQANGAAVLLLHGGGWRIGDRSLALPHAERLAQRGYLTLAVDYRLLSEAPWPAALEDVEHAIAWGSDRAAALGYEASKLAVMGLSAGGHLALLAGARQPVAAVVALYPPTRFAALPDDQARALGAMPASSVLGEGPSDEDAEAIGPLAYVRLGFPPTLLVHGSRDTFVPYEGTVELHRRLLEAGSVSDLWIVGCADHAFDYGASHGETVAAVVDSFLRRTVVEPDRIAAETPDPERLRAALAAAPDLPAIEALQPVLREGRSTTL